VDISRVFILIETSRIFGLVESSRFFRRRVDIGGNLRLIDFSEFLRF